MMSFVICCQTSGAALGADQDTSVQDGLDLFELADVMVEAGAMSAINLVGGGVASMTENQSSIVDPAGDCLGPSGVESAIGFGDESKLARCEVPVSSIVCVHLDPPPFVPGFSGTPAPTPAQGSSSANGGGGAGDGKGDDQHDTWAHSEQDACDDTFNGNVTVWQHLDDVEEAVWRYKVREASYLEPLIHGSTLVDRCFYESSNDISVSRTCWAAPGSPLLHAKESIDCIVGLVILHALRRGDRCRVAHGSSCRA